jgi:hypothetical protein
VLGAGAMIAAVSLSFVGAPLRTVLRADDGTGNLIARQAVEDLVVCYSLGTDSFGRAVNAIGGQPLDSTVNLSDPDFAAGLAYYRRCFSEDFTFKIKSGGTIVVTVPNPATRTASTDAALEWANFVNNAFRAPKYRSTQHFQGTIASVINDNTATSQNYLIATQVYGPTAARTGIDRIGGTYTDEDVRVQGRWLIQTRTLEITSSVHIPTGL